MQIMNNFYYAYCLIIGHLVGHLLIILKQTVFAKGYDFGRDQCLCLHTLIYFNIYHIYHILDSFIVLILTANLLILLK